MELKEFCCPNCKAPLTPVKDARYMFCQYCGTRIVIDDIDYYREDSKTERERIKADKEVKKTSVEKDAEVELQRLKNEDNKNDTKVVAIIFIAGIVLILLLCIFGVVGELMGW